MSWYRKYRPMRFENLVGQNHIRTILLTALKSGNASHAYLLSGPRGTGKTSTARILGKSLNCLNPDQDGEPCNVCRHCCEINEGRFVDLIEIDAASNTGVDHIRDLRDKIGFSPTSGKAKVYIIDEVHMLSTGAFNALLKTLEEPPSFVYFILATTELHKVPQTIQSRCQRFSFRRLSSQDILYRLQFIADQEKIIADEKALHIIAHQAAGGLRDAISLFEQQAVSGEVTAEMLTSQMGLTSASVAQEFCEALEAANVKAAFDLVDSLTIEGFSLFEFIRTFLLFLREKLLEETRNDTVIRNILFLVETFDDAQRKMKFAVIPQLPIEVAIVKSVQHFTADVSSEKSTGILGMFTGTKKQTSKTALPEENKQHDTSPDEQSSDSREEAPKQKDEPKPEAEFLAPELNLESIKSSWSKILEKLSSSLLRMSLRNATIRSFENKTLILDFPAKTWKEQVEKTENEEEIIRAFEEVFSQKIEIKSSISTVQLEPAVVDNQDRKKVQNAASSMEMFQEIMGTPSHSKEE